ncbi:TorF family putative porin [Hydrogenophaga sp. 5NK40-0174]|uniref:TorF family putative porin n=1 Tax=Hydrogenophaga sp. 5NK40-0174 TaxID=3127649 RepID=UPI003103C7ED
MIKAFPHIAVAIALAATAASASAEGISYNVGITSLYKFNGIDQDVRASKNVRPALQGGVDYDFGNGLYVGNWNSTGQFGAMGKADLEIDVYGGYRGEFGEGWRYDVGAIRFIFPKDNTWNANEMYVRLGYGIFTAQFGHGFGNGNKAARLGLSLAHPITEQLTIEAGMGFRNKENMGGATDAHLGVVYDLGSGLMASGRISGAETAKAGPAGKTRLAVSLIKVF